MLIVINIRIGSIHFKSKTKSSQPSSQYEHRPESSDVGILMYKALTFYYNNFMYTILFIFTQPYENTILLNIILNWKATNA